MTEKEKFDFSKSPALSALKLIKEKHPTERGITGSIPCPNCKADSQYSIARSNGHVHWRCSGCGIAFMQ